MTELQSRASRLPLEQSNSSDANRLVKNRVPPEEYTML